MSEITALISTATTGIIGFSAIQNQMMGLVIPVILLFITLICFALDFGVVGVGTIASVTLIVLGLLQIIPILNFASLIPLIIIIMIVIFKVGA